MTNDTKVMICIKCGFVKAGEPRFFTCDDCTEFSKLVRYAFDDIHEKMETARVIDPKTTPILQLLSDSTFLTSKNPQLSIFYKISTVLISEARKGNDTIGEGKLNRRLQSIRSLSDALKSFESLGLIRVTIGKYDRVLKITDKTRKFASSYDASLGNLSQVSLVERLAQIFSGYVILSLLKELAEVTALEGIIDLPYGKRPRTLWVILMFLLLNTKRDAAEFREEGCDFIDEEMRMFIARRRIPAANIYRTIDALQAVDTQSTQGLIKDVRMEDGSRKFTFENYVIDEMQRIREFIRERER